MPIVLPSSFVSEIEKPHGTQPLIWLVELEVARPAGSGAVTTPGLIVRLCNYGSAITWPASAPSATTWNPLSFSFTQIEQTNEGDLPQLELTVDNTTKTLMRYLHAGEGLEGNYCTIYLVPQAGLSIAYPNHEYQRWDMTVAGAYATEEAIAFRLERANFFTRQSPQDRYVASRCRWEFGSGECGYVVNAVAAYTTCPKTLSACIARGQDHAARGLPVLHPARFGGFPGIPRQR
jgi:phage-related protein